MLPAGAARGLARRRCVLSPSEAHSQGLLPQGLKLVPVLLAELLRPLGRIHGARLARNSTLHYLPKAGRSAKSQPLPPHEWEASAEATGDRLVAWQVSLLGPSPSMWEQGSPLPLFKAQTCVTHYKSPSPTCHQLPPRTAGCGPFSEPVRGLGRVGPLP